MVEIKGKTIIYTIPNSSHLQQLSPYSFIEKLEDEIVITWPQLTVNKVFSSKKQHSYQIYCVLPSKYANEQVRLIKVQIELIAASLSSKTSLLQNKITLLYSLNLSDLD
jgi:hypothetical protein